MLLFTDSEYMDRDKAATLDQAYDEIIGTFVGMICHFDKWVSQETNQHANLHLVTTSPCHVVMSAGRASAGGRRRPDFS